LRQLPRSAVVSIQLAFAAAVAWFAGRAIQEQWSKIDEAHLSLHPRWSWIVLSAVVVWATYGLLIAIWVMHMRAWGQRLPFGPAARIWFISNLGRYVPGKVVGLGTMAVMSERRGVSPVAAVGSSVLVMLVSIVAGLAVVLFTGAGVAEAVIEASGLNVPRWAVAGTAIIGVIGLAIAPMVLPRVLAFATRMSGRPSVLPVLPPSSVWKVAAGTAVSWLTYGAAFQLFSTGMLGRNAGALGGYIAVWAASYLAGLLSLIPGGLVVREAALVLALAALDLVTAPEAAMLAVTSRIWLTILEVIPGALFLIARAERASGEPGSRL
jgi:uncharacterized membrane protein YbhN (UPF0104 family)